MLPVLDAEALKGASDDVVTDTREVTDVAASDEDHLVLLEVMTFAADVGGDFIAVGETDSGVLSGGRVRLLGGHRTDTGANTLLLRGRDLLFPLVERIPSLAQGRRLGLVDRLLSLVSHELVDCRHSFPPNFE